MVFKLAHYGLSTFLIEVMTMMMMMMIKCPIIIIIISIIDTALVDRVCICHLRKETPTIRFPPDGPHSEKTAPQFVDLVFPKQPSFQLSLLADLRRLFCSVGVSVIWVA